MYDFQDRTLVLTGAAGGIGREIARLFARHGAHLVLADQHIEELQAFATTLRLGPERLLCMAFDAASQSDAQRLVDAAHQHSGGIDFLVPAAGIYQPLPVATMSVAQWRQTLTVNLDGAFFLGQAALPLLRPGSAIVHVSSVAAHRGARTQAHFASSKAGLVGLTHALARELAPLTRVNAVSPGVIDTPMTSALVAAAGDEIVRQTPLGRLGQPSEVASAVGFLCSSAASFITGSVLHVNGGLHMN